MWLDVDIQRRMRAAGQVFDLRVALCCTAPQVVLCGPSGAGKSLTLRAVAGLLRPDHGHVRLHGEDVFRRTGQARVDVPARRRRIGYVFQDYALFPFLSVRQNVAFGLQGGWLNPSPDRRDERVERWLHALRIDGVADSLPGEISGGQRQRTALARALAPGPQALLLDEPFAALDHALRDHLRSELQHVLAQAGIPLLLISHDPQDVAMFGGQVFRIDGGRVVGPDEAGSSSPLTPPCP